MKLKFWKKGASPEEQLNRIHLLIQEEAMKLERARSKRKGSMKSDRAGLELKMQSCLSRLGVPLKVLWVPDGSGSKHGEIQSNCLFVYGQDEDEAWSTFEHEVYEYKFKEVTYAYHTLANSLIEVFEKLAYERKEKFINFIPEISRAITEERP